NLAARSVGWTLGELSVTPELLQPRIFRNDSSFLKYEAIVFGQDSLLFNKLEPCGEDFFGEGLLPGANMVHHPVGTHAFDPLEIDQYISPTGPERTVDGLHRFGRELEVVIGVADESQVDRVRRQGHGGLGADDADHVLDAFLLARFRDVVDKLPGNV